MLSWLEKNYNKLISRPENGWGPLSVASLSSHSASVSVSGWTVGLSRAELSSEPVLTRFLRTSDPSSLPTHNVFLQDNPPASAGILRLSRSSLPFPHTHTHTHGSGVSGLHKTLCRSRSQYQLNTLPSIEHYYCTPIPN